jgi:hypothetical protein
MAESGRTPERCFQMSDTEKSFDAVALMRAARDRISAEIAGTTLEEELEWLTSQDLQDSFLKRLRDRAVPALHTTRLAGSGRA